MRIPKAPPQLPDLIDEATRGKRLGELFLLNQKQGKRNHDYLHWDRLQRYPPPEGMTHREWWLMEKLSRLQVLKEIPLKDKQGGSFWVAVPEQVQEALHQIDLGAGGTVSVPDPIITPQTRDRYLMTSLMEEAIASSQLEGAVTTREVAKEMIRTGRPPRDTSEQMVLNNYRTMQQIREVKDQPLSPELVFRIHRLVTEKTLDDPSAAGRFRTELERRVVGDDFGEVYHDPPPAAELPGRLAAMCAFANGETPGFFVHPAVRAILLHFWLAYDHPFVDGNGRTARALFYWAMLKRHYWLFEFVSISHILRQAPAKYGRSFLYTETDGNDLTYFLIAQVTVIQKAIEALHAYIRHKAQEAQAFERRVRALDRFNHRQAALLLHALKHPGHPYTIAGHRSSHQVVYQTARTDLLALVEAGLLEESRKRKQYRYTAPADLSARLQALDEEG